VTLAVLLLSVATAAQAAVVTAPGYLARTIPTPDTVQGGVVRRGDALLVGQGAFGAGRQYIVRLDGATATTVATGFNSLGGFDVELNGNLLVVDNGGELPGAVTGDTLYEIPNATRRMSAVTAAGHEVLPPGSIPNAQDVLGIPETVLVTDAVGPGAGRVLRVSEEGDVEVAISGLDFLGGLAFAPGGTIFVVNLDATFRGAILGYDYFGFPRGVVADGLSGAFAAVLDADQATVLVSGGVAADGSGSVIALGPDGAVRERARGFGFTTDLFFDPTREELLVLDVGVAAVTAICADGDADGVCDADDPCTVARPVTRPRIDVGRRLRVAGRTALDGAFDPAASGARFVLESAAGTVLDVDVPAGVGWKRRKGGNSWTWRAPAGADAGITRMRLVVRRGVLVFVVVGRPTGAVPPAFRRSVPRSASTASRSGAPARS
jgi:hypothetical protein